MNSPGKGETFPLQDGRANTARLRALKRWGCASLAGCAGRSNSPYALYHLVWWGFRPSRANYFYSKADKSNQKPPFGAATAVRVSYLIKADLPFVRHWDGSLDQRETVGGWLGRGSLVGAGELGRAGATFHTRHIVPYSDRISAREGLEPVEATEAGAMRFPEETSQSPGGEVATGSCPRESGAQCKGAFFSFIFLPQQKNELARVGRNPHLAGWHGEDGAATRPEEVGLCQLGQPCRAKRDSAEGSVPIKKGGKHPLPAFFLSLQ